MVETEIAPFGDTLSMPNRGVDRYCHHDSIDRR